MVGFTDSEEELLERSFRDSQRAAAAVGHAWSRASNAVRESTPASLAFPSDPLLPVHRPAQPVWQPTHQPVQPPPTQLRRLREESCPEMCMYGGGDELCDICDYGPPPPPDLFPQDGDADDMAADSPASKSTASRSSGPTDMDSIMPLLFATIGNPSISYKKMAAMDPQGRSDSALEHKFRKWRQAGREIALKNPEHAGPVKPATPKNSRVNKAANDKQPNTAGDDVDDDTKPAAATIKKGKVKAGKSTAGKAGHQVNGAKKRGTSNELDEDIKDNESPTKKAKVTKKGMAKVIKKPSKKPRETVETESESSSESEDNGISVPATKNGKGKTKSTPKGCGATKENKSPAKKGNGKAPSSKQGSMAPEKDQDPMDVEEDEDMGGKTEMQFGV